MKRGRLGRGRLGGGRLGGRKLGGRKLGDRKLGDRRLGDRKLGGGRLGGVMAILRLDLLVTDDAEVSFQPELMNLGTSYLGRALADPA